MAKKKSGPSRECEKCKKRYHPRKAECPHCGKPNPTAGKGKKVVKKKPAKKTGRRKARKPAAATAATGGSLDAAVAFVESVGGLDAAKAALAQIDRIKQL